MVTSVRPPGPTSSKCLAALPLPLLRLDQRVPRRAQLEENSGGGLLELAGAEIEQEIEVRVRAGEYR